MALLGDIRKKSWLLILGIGLPLFAFIIGDAFSQGSIFGDPNELGSVGGTPINIQDYNMAYNRLSKNPQLQDAGENAVSEMAWNQLVSERLVTDQMSELGVGVDEGKYYEEAGRFFSSVNPNLVENGRVNIELTKTFVSELKTAAQSGNPQAQNFYGQWENANPQFRLLNRVYTGLVSAGALATDVDAAFLNKGNATNDIEYVLIKYDDYAEKNKIEVTDDEILAYMKDYPKTYKAEPSVNLAYAYFPGEASTQDKNAIQNELKSYLNTQVLKDEVNGVTDTIQSFATAVNDSAYVSRFSDAPFDPTYYTKQQFESFPDENLKKQLLQANKGDVIGPIQVGNVYNLIKVSDVKAISDSAKTSHILIGYQGSEARAEGITRTPQEAKDLADSLLVEIKSNPAKFDEYARTLSDDKVAAQDGGDIGWVGRFQQGFAQTYRDFAVTHPKGTIDVVPSQFGFHIIRVDDVKQVTGYQLATIQKEVRASDETQEHLFSTANNLAINAQGKSANDFINAAREEGADVNNADGLKRFDSNLVGLQGTKKEADILRWAFNDDTEAGSVQSFETINGGQIVAYLSNKFEEGDYNVASAKSQVVTKIRNAKIAKKIADETNDADLKNVASKYGTSTQSASISFARPTIEGAGLEPRVGGAVMGLSEGKTSGTIEGNTGVYFVKVVKKGEPNKVEDYTNQRNSVESQHKSLIQNRIIPSLIDATDVKDNRINKLK